MIIEFYQVQDNDLQLGIMHHSFKKRNHQFQIYEL